MQDKENTGDDAAINKELEKALYGSSVKTFLFFSSTLLALLIVVFVSFTGGWVNFLKIFKGGVSIALLKEQMPGVININVIVRFAITAVILMFFLLANMRIFNFRKAFIKSKKNLDKCRAQISAFTKNPEFTGDILYQLKESRFVGYLAEINKKIKRQLIRKPDAAIDYIINKEIKNMRTINYMHQSMIIFGLLGTFIGVMIVVATMKGFLHFDSNNNMLIERLVSFLGGLDTAFTTSIFGILCYIFTGYYIAGIRRSQESYFRYMENIMKYEIFPAVFPDFGAEDLTAVMETLKHNMKDLSSLPKIMEKFIKSINQFQTLNDKWRNSEAVFNKSTNKFKEGAETFTKEMGLVAGAMKSQADVISMMSEKVETNHAKINENFNALAGKIEDSFKVAINSQKVDYEKLTDILNTQHIELISKTVTDHDEFKQKFSVQYKNTAAKIDDTNKNIGIVAFQMEKLMKMFGKSPEFLHMGAELKTTKTMLDGGIKKFLRKLAGKN
ncbi:MAG: hypothetical protein J7M11_01615 [Elusimicrobia bacterium]|nr:hypothetical protein [Elusimicrobiota bacterium]